MEGGSKEIKNDRLKGSEGKICMQRGEEWKEKHEVRKVFNENGAEPV